MNLLLLPLVEELLGTKIVESIRICTSLFIILSGADPHRLLSLLEDGRILIYSNRTVKYSNKTIKHYIVILWYAH